MGAGQTTTTVESASHEACGHERMCVVCRERRAPEQLLRLGLKGGLLRFDRKTGKGRSGWLCPDRDCLEKLSAPMIGRASRYLNFVFPTISTRSITSEYVQIRLFWSFSGWLAAPENYASAWSRSLEGVSVKTANRS